MIKFSRKEDYAIILINKLAQEYGKRLIPLSEVSQEYSISLLFLRNLAQEMRRAGLIKATEGKSGGYCLARDPKEVKMGDVLSIFSKQQLMECCPVDKKSHTRCCPKKDSCVTGNVWRQLNKEFLDKIYSLSVTDFMTYKVPSKN